MAQQKLESYATGIVFNMVQGRGGMVNEEQGKDIVRTAVSMAYEMLNEIHGIRRSED